MGEEAASNQFSSNSARYAQRAATAETLRATQEELATKIRELQIYETNYMGLKKDLARWKKKFEYVFRENELLALETGKLDASHKQIAFLQQEIKFKEEEGTALRGLVSALEAANKKQRATRLDSAARGSGLRGSDVAAAVAAERKSNEDAEAALAEARQTHAEEKTRLTNEVAALKAENALLLKDLDRKELAVQRQEEQVSAHKGRIAGLEQALQAEQDSSMARLREKQDRVADLELQLQQMQMRRRSSVAAALARAEEEGQEMVGFGAVDRLRLPRTESVEEGDEQAEGIPSDEEPDTPPGTPPPINAGGLLPPEDPTADQTVRDWVDDRKIRAARSLDEALDMQRLTEFIDKLPYEAKDGVRRLLMDVLAPEDGSGQQAVAESQILLRAVPTERQRELQEFLVPLLKAHHGLRVTYATMQRRTLVTDVRVTLERRRESVTGGLPPGEKRFGKDHAFFGPSSDDVSKLVPHAPRELSTANKAIYVSKPKHVEPLSSPATDERSSDQTQDMDSPSESSETNTIATGAGTGANGEATAASNRMWRGMSAAKFIGTMAAGAKQRVAATFKNAKYTHEGTSCQFCKMSPIVGPRYSCATCVGFDLCETCYSLGGHGLENSDELFYRVQELVLARCPRLLDEIDLLELMRYEICRSNLRKFSFCLNWLADIVNGKTSRELQARALEIPSIRRDVRKQFVPLLMRVCSDREDIEVKTEWELEDDDAAAVRTVVRGSLSEGDNGFIETLRIWVADQYRTTSPFVERSLLKFREGEEGEEDASDSEEDGGDEGTRANTGAATETEVASSQPGFLERNRIQSQQF